MKEVLILAAELVISRSGGVTTEDGNFATVDDDAIIRLDCAIAQAFDLDSDDVNIEDMDKIRNIVSFDLSIKKDI